VNRQDARYNNKDSLIYYLMRDNSACLFLLNKFAMHGTTNIKKVCLIVIWLFYMLLILMVHIITTRI